MVISRGLAFILIVGAFNLYAVTEPGSNVPNLVCESALFEDPFYRLIEKAVEQELIGSMELHQLVMAETPYNPLAMRLKKNPALLQALSAQLKMMTPERWTRLRNAIKGLSARRQVVVAAQAESYKNTARLLSLEEMAKTPVYLTHLDLSKTRWHWDGAKTTVILRSSEGSQMLVDTDGFAAVNLQGQASGFGTPTASVQYVRFGEKTGLINPFTLERVRELLPRDIGVVRAANRDYVLNLSGFNKNHLTAYPLEGWSFKFWRPRIQIDGFLWGQAMQVQDVTYLAVDRVEVGLKLYRFDGKRFKNIEIGGDSNCYPTQTSMRLGLDGSLNLLTFCGGRGHRHGILRRIVDEKLVETEDLRESFDNVPEFWTDVDGRLAVLGETKSEAILRFLDKDVQGEYRALLPQGYVSVVGAFRYQGGYAAVLYDLDGKIKILDMNRGQVAASFDIKVNRNDAGFSVFDSPDGQVYLLGLQDRNVLGFYTLTKEPVRSRRED